MPKPTEGSPALRVTETECKTALVSSGLADYALNCYRGCEHGCVYCYARFASRFSHPGEEWGTFIDVRVNAPQVLDREVRRKQRGRVFVSSVCDGWHPLEERYRLTRTCLESLIHNDFPVTLLTKSKLVRRDFDVLASTRSVEVEVTITTLDEELRSAIEPRSSTSLERIEVLQAAKDRGIRTYAFIGPLIPFMSDGETKIGPLLKLLREVGVDYFYVDRLNPRWGVWPAVRRVLVERSPSLVAECRSVLYAPAVRGTYSDALRGTVLRLARQYSLDAALHICF